MKAIAFCLLLLLQASAGYTQGGDAPWIGMNLSIDFGKVRVGGFRDTAVPVGIVAKQQVGPWYAKVGCYTASPFNVLDTEVTLYYWQLPQDSIHIRFSPPAVGLYRSAVVVSANGLNGGSSLYGEGVQMSAVFSDSRNSAPPAITCKSRTLKITVDGIDEPRMLTISDVLGRTVFNAQVEFVSGQSVTKLPSSLPTAAYFGRIDKVPTVAHFIMAD